MDGNKFLILKVKDIFKYLRQTNWDSLEDVIEEINSGRKSEGKNTDNKYIVINRDEPYANEVIEIMKKYNHWEQ